MNIDGDFPLYHKEEENINHLSKSCYLVYNIWSLLINFRNLDNTSSGLWTELNIFGFIRL